MEHDQPSQSHLEALELQSLNAQDRLRLAFAQNVATNGRLFCIMIFAACVVAHLGDHGSRFLALAVFAAAPVGLACIVDQMPHGFAQKVLSWAIRFMAAGIAILLLIKLG